MPSFKHHNALVRLIAKYSVRLSDLYDKFTDKLVVLGVEAGITENDPLFHFDEVPEIKSELTELMKKYATEQLLTFKSGIYSGVALAFEHDNATLSKYSILSNKAIQETRENTAEAFYRNRLNTKNGLNLSHNVWNYTEQAKGEVETAMSNVIADGIRKGESAESIGRQVREYLNNPDMMYRRYHQNVVENGTKKDVVMWRRRVVDADGNVRFVEEPLEQVGTGTYRSARKNSYRLARTEINASYHKANYDRWQQEPFVIGIRIFLSPQHPVYDICDPLEGNYPKDFLWMGWHPQCMCASAPITIEGEEKREFYRRMLAGEDMSDYESPNAITDVPEAYKQYVREHIDEIVSADLRGKLAWHFRDNRKYWENIELSKLVDKASIAEDQHIERNRAEYERYKNDPNYRDVEFNEDNGGLRATHIEHTFDKKKGWYEKEAQRIGFNEGHSVIFGKEDHTRYKVRNNEGYWDNMIMETAGAETCTSENIRNALKHCAKKPNVEVAVIFLPNKFDGGELRRGLGRYNGLRNTRQWREFKEIIFIYNDKIL